MILLSQMASTGYFSDKEYDEIRQALRGLPQDFLKQSPYNPFTPEQQVAILDKHAEEYQEIAARFGEGDGTLYNDPVVIDESGGNLSLSGEAVLLVASALHKHNLKQNARIEQKLIHKKITKTWQKLKKKFFSE